MLTEYELLTRFNPIYIANKTAVIREQIQEMYYKNTPVSQTLEVGLFTTVTYPLEKLVIDIVDAKESLSRYERQSIENLNMLKEVMDSKNRYEQVEIMKYFNSKGLYRPFELIEQLRRDLYELSNSERNKRDSERMKAKEERKQLFREQFSNRPTVNIKEPYPTVLGGIL